MQLAPTCPYTSCIDCWIGHSNGNRAGPDLVSGSCSCMLLLHPALTCAYAGPDLCTLRWWHFPSINWCKYYTCTRGGQYLLQLALVVFFHPSAGANTPLAHLVVITCCNLRWWCFPSFEFPLAHVAIQLDLKDVGVSFTAISQRWKALLQISPFTLRPILLQI